jgi:hypothetical protein
MITTLLIGGALIVVAIEFILLRWQVHRAEPPPTKGPDDV